MPNKIWLRGVQLPAALVIALACAAPAAAQRPAAWTPFDDWSRVVLGRLHALGHTPALDPVPLQRPLTLTALDSALHGDPWVRRLLDERAGARHTRFRLEAGPALVIRTGAVRTGRFTLERAWQAPVPRRDFIEPGATALAHVTAVPHVGLTLHASGHGSAWRADHATLDLTFDAAHVWLGRRAIGYAPGETGGLVLTRLPRLAGAGITVHERRLAIGAAAGELFVGRIADNGHVADPWLIGMRVHVTPHARFDIGGTRVAQFGSMTGSRIGVRQLLEVLIGANLSPPHADDHVASLDARWRLPLALPFLLYGEWGLHDADPGVFLDVPAFTLGVRAAALPHAPRVGLSIEHTQISHSCCGNPPWYHHFEFADGWAAAGAPLGHPLGGHGREWRAAAETYTSPVIARITAARRYRGSENLYAPTRAGAAAAVAASAAARLGQRVAVHVTVSAERGDDWTDVHVFSGVRWRF